MTAITLTSATLNKATAVLTSDNTNVADGDTVTVGSTVYRFKDTPAAAYDVKRHVSTADTSLGNLVKAINGTGTPGTEYYAGTAAHPTVTASAVAAHATTLTAISVLTVGSTVATTETSAHLSFGAATMSGGGTMTLQTTVADEDLTMIVRQRMVVENSSPLNPNFSRNIDVSDEALVVRRYLSRPVALWTEDFVVKVAVLLEPSLTWLPKVTTQPEDDAVAAGADAVYTVVAVSEVAADQTYQWQGSSDGVNWADLPVSAPFSGTTSAELTVTAAGDSMTYYRCVVSNSAGDTTTAEVRLVIYVAIVTDPVNVDNSGSPSDPAIFSVEADGQPDLVFQWQISEDSGGTWADLADGGVYTGTALAELDISNSTGLGGNEYRCVVSNSVSTATSAPATLTSD